VNFRGLNGALLALGVVCLPVASAQAESVVLGDSLGMGVAKVAKIKGLARLSVHIRGPKAVKQIAETPAGSTAFLVLGTNDANGSIARLDKSIDAIVAAAEKRNITLVWIGPPCVRKSWDTRARALDSVLRDRLAGTAVRYVSMRDEEMCSGALHDRDGVHLKTRGYVHMWQKANAAAGIALASAQPEKDAPEATPEATPAATAAAPKKVARSRHAPRRSSERGTLFGVAH
jgi:hypothetical protein